MKDKGKNVLGTSEDSTVTSLLFILHSLFLLSLSHLTILYFSLVFLVSGYMTFSFLLHFYVCEWG